MAWVKMKNKFGSIVEIPEPVYENMFKGNNAYSLVEDNQPKPTPKTEIKQEVVKDEQIQEPRLDENNNNRKGTKKNI